MKKSWVFSLIALLAPLVSAYYPPSTTLSTSMIDANTVFMAFAFLFVFAGVMWVFRKNKSMGVLKTMLSFGIALFLVWRIWISQFNFEQFVNNIGFGSIIWPILILGIAALLIYIMIKGKLQAIFFILSGLSFLAAIFFSVIGQWQYYAIAGAIFLILGLISKKNRRTKKFLGRLLIVLAIVSFILAALNLVNPILAFIILGIIFLLIGIALLKKPKINASSKNEKIYSKNEEEIKDDVKKVDDIIKQEKKQPPQYQDRTRLARLIGIKNLQKQLADLYASASQYQNEFDEGVKEATKLHGEAAKLGWTKTKKGREAYRKWYRQYNRNGELEQNIIPKIRKQIQEVTNKIQHLQDRI